MKPSKVIILGMHAGGTTLLAEMVHALGYKVKPPVLGADIRHPNGYFESFEVVNRNRFILREAGGRWNNPPSHKDILKVKITQVEGHELIKDPRLCLTLPLWDFEGKILVIERPQMSVALSLRSFNKMPLSEGLSLWETYQERLKKNLKGKRFFKVYYDDLVDGMNLSKLADFLETTKIDNMQRVINKDLRHF